MNAAVAGLKGNMKKDLNTTVNKKSTPWPSQCSSQILGLQATLLSSGWKRRFEPSVPAEGITGGKRHYLSCFPSAALTLE